MKAGKELPWGVGGGRGERECVSGGRGGKKENEIGNTMEGRV